jgi:hypothetical protein
VPIEATCVLATRGFCNEFRVKQLKPLLSHAAFLGEGEGL